MNRHLAHRQGPASRGLALAASAVIVLIMFGLQLGAMNRAAWRVVLRPGPASLDQASAAITGSVALVLIGWLLIALVVSLLAALGSGSSALGLAAARAARLVAPTILRNAIAALLGVAIAAAPAAADPAHPVTSERTTNASAATSAIRQSQRPSPSAASASPSAAESDLSPAWLPALSLSSAVSATSATVNRPDSQSPATRPAAARPAAARPATANPATANPATANPATGQPATRQPTPADPQLSPGWIPTRPTRSIMARNPDNLAPVGASATRARIVPDDQIVVRRGDTLWDIAARHLGPGATDGEIALEWPHWFAANRAVIGSDPDHLVAGERLRAPERQSVERRSDERQPAASGPAAARRTARGGAGR